jgi:hypothetical protein
VKKRDVLRNYGREESKKKLVIYAVNPLKKRLASLRRERRGRHEEIIQRINKR